MKTLIKSTELGHDWIANQYDDGTMTIRSPVRAQRIELPRESVELLRSIILSHSEH